MKQEASVKLGRGHSGTHRGHTLQQTSQNKNIFVSNRFPVCARVSGPRLRAVLQFQVYFQQRANCTSSYFYTSVGQQEGSGEQKEY